MNASKLMKGCFIFLIVMMSISVNADDNTLSRLGLEVNYLMMALVAVVVTGLVMHRELLCIILAVFLSIGANMPSDFMLNFGIDRDYFTGILVAFVLVPVIEPFVE